VKTALSGVRALRHAYDLTQTAWSAAQLAGCDPKTVKRYVEASNAGCSPYWRGGCQRVAQG